MARKTYAETLKNQRLLVFNSSKPEILPFLEKFGIDLPHIKKGEGTFNELMELDKSQKIEYQEQGLAYDNYQDARSHCSHFYKNTLKLIKMASRDDKNLQDRIKIKNGRIRIIEEWISQAVEFYNLVLNENEFVSKIVKYGLTAEKLQEERDEISALILLRNEAMSEQGQAQEATNLRDKKREELKDYCYELKTVAIIALEDHPQLLEKLGIIVKS